MKKQLTHHKTKRARVPGGKALFLALLAIGLLFLAACGAGGGGSSDSGDGEPGLILYQPAGEAGLPAPELVVTDVSGNEQHHIPLSDLLQIRKEGFVTRFSHRALFFAENGTIYLVDAGDGTAQELELPPEAGRQLSPNPSGFSLAGGKKWVVLASAMGDQGYLVDLETGQVTSLTAMNRRIEFFLGGQFSPDDAYLSLNGGMNFWLAPTSSLKDARPLEAANVNFSNDGRQIVYVMLNKQPKEWQVVVEAVDGSKSEIVLTADTFIDPHVAFGPGQNQLVFMTEETLSLLDANDGTEKELLAYEGHPERLWFSPDGEKLVFGDKRKETTVWHWIDLTEGAAKSLDNLAGYVPLYQDAGHHWLMFADSNHAAVNHHFVSLNLESGKAQEVMLFDEKTTILPLMLSKFSDDGRFSLINAIIKETSQQQLWLLDAEKGQARMLAEADGVIGATSPDGQWVVVNTIKRNGEARETNLTLMAMEGEETRPLGAGYVRAWVRP